jgi:two-component system nitrate/nitrite response regulator NarL
VASLLLQEAGYDVVEVEDTEALVAAARADHPDLVLVDSRFAPDAELHRALPAVRSAASAVIVWGFNAPATAAVAAIEAGADGFLDKDISPSGLLRALDAALRGEAVLPRNLVRAMVDSLRHMDERYRARELVMTLSPREREVLGMIASGARNRTIAASLEISEFTVKRHVQNILRKLGLPSRRVAAMLHQSATVDGRAALERLNPIRLPLLHPAGCADTLTADSRAARVGAAHQRQPSGPALRPVEEFLDPGVCKLDISGAQEHASLATAQCKQV